MTKSVLALDSHKLKIAITCLESYNLAHNENLRRFIKLPQDRRFADKGTIVHALMDIYYTLRSLNPNENAIFHGTEALKIFRKNKLCEKAGFDKEFEQLIQKRFTQYVFKYHMWDFIPLKHGRKPGVEVGFSYKLYEDSQRVFILEGRIDLLARQAGEKCFVDHKTQGRAQNLYPEKIQFLSYALSSGINRGVVNYFGLQKEYKEGVTLRQDSFYIPDYRIQAFKEYLIEEYFKIEAALKSNSFEKNLVACAGPDEKRPCPFVPICTAPNIEIASLIKQQFYEKVNPWTPWDLDEKESA